MAQPLNREMRGGWETAPLFECTERAVLHVPGAGLTQRQQDQFLHGDLYSGSVTDSAPRGTFKFPRGPGLWSTVCAGMVEKYPRAVSRGSANPAKLPAIGC